MTATIAAPARKSHSGAGQKAIPVALAPRVSLLPPELDERKKSLAAQRSLRLALFGIVVLTIAAIGGAWYLSWTASTSLAAAQDETAALLAEQETYADVRRAVSSVELGEAALRVGGSTEVDWRDYLGLVQASLPGEVVINSYSVDAATVTTQYPQSDIPLQGARIAELHFTTTSQTLPSIPDWLVNLRSLPGFVDAEPGTVQLNEGVYTAGITMHIDAEVYTNRLTEKEDAK